MDTRLDWHTGMELTPDTFIESDKMEYQYKVLLRKIIASKTYGLIPDMKKELDWYVGHDNIIINSLKFNALAHSGEIISVDIQQTELSLPSNHNTEPIYVAVELTKEDEVFIQNGVEKIRQKCILVTKNINELNERQSSNIIPFGKINTDHERYNKDEQYVPPIITIESSPDLRELIDTINNNICAIIYHDNFVCQGNDLTISILREHVISINANETPSRYVDVCHDFVMLLALYIFKDKVVIPKFEPNDIMIWFNWFNDLTINALSLLNSLIVEEVNPQHEEHIEDEFTPII